MRNLTYIVENYSIKSGIVGTQHFQQLLQFATDGYRKLRDLGQVQILVKAVKLDIVDHKANLPIDFVELIRIGVCRCGIMIPFDKNDALCLPHEEKCDCTAESINNCFSCASNQNAEGNSFWAFPVFGQPYSFSYSVGSYAIGPGNYSGGYKIDWHNQQIIFDHCVECDSCVLEYVGDFLNDMGNAMVPEKLIEPLVQWMDYERKYWSPDASYRRESGNARVRWYQTVRDLNSNNNAFNKHEWVELFRSYCYQGNKG